MIRRQFIFVFIAVANGCAPSIPANDPVLTTTSTATATPITTTTTALTTTVLSNSSTTTTTSSPNTTTTTSTTGSTTTVATTSTVPTTTTVLTTTTVPTTTIPPNCCGYPIRASTTNSAMPPSVRWNGCNESVSLTCQDSGIEGVIQIVGIIANYNTVDYSSSSSVVNNIVSF
ncbi:hypothetical protein B9Z55_022711 [Caenorhabditis nigoni]|uniref:C6 domain-containing protein n=1 Tax=Caenorhabditis nigoni TaxID=1611254 RepID=A0A2G5SM56_9PELO|nr:hypothetical protein B9Z55_022711 [Caenorhabditis nigoni]